MAAPIPLVAASSVYKVFQDLYYATGAHKKKLHYHQLIETQNMTVSNAQRYKVEGERLGVIVRISNTEFKHSEFFIKMIQARRFADEAQKEFLSQNELYREVILNFGNVVPSLEQLEIFFSAYGLTDSTIKKTSGVVRKSLQELEAIGMLNFNLEELRGAPSAPPRPKPKPKPKPEPQGGGAANDTNPPKPHPDAPDFSEVDDTPPPPSTGEPGRGRGEHRDARDDKRPNDEIPGNFRIELDNISEQLDRLHQAKAMCREMIDEWLERETKIDLQIAELRQREAEIKAELRKLGF